MDAVGRYAIQVIVSGGLGFGASVLAGAAIDSFVPVPALGTTLGALGGATVGLFTSGAIESIYENGIDSVGDVIGDGFEAALTVVLGSFLGQRVRGRIGTGNLAFTANGVEQRGWTFTSRLAWDDLVGVTASYGAFREILLVARPGSDWHGASTTRIWRIDRLPPVPLIQIDCSRYDAGSVELLEFIRFYLENPHARNELGTPVAAARLANEPMPRVH